MELKEISNTEYHSEQEHLSSSNLKLLLTDLPKFYQEKVLKIKSEKEDKPQFSEGSYLHSLILEPEKIEEEYAFFDGWKKMGKEWVEFKEKNKGKIILSKPQRKKIENLFNLYDKNEAAKDLVSGSQYEVTLFGEIDGVKLKVRADGINPDKGYIFDVKTTSFDIDADSFKVTCDRFHYKLSASLYLKLFEDYYKKPFDFYFIVLGKEDLGCKVFKLSKESRDIGNLEITRAIKIYKTCLETNNWTTYEKNDKIQEEIEEV